VRQGNANLACGRSPLGRGAEPFLSRALVLQTFQVNIVSFFETTKAAVKHIKPGGSVINTGSIQAYSPTNKILDYACTKAAIVDFTKVHMQAQTLTYGELSDVISSALVYPAAASCR
jgi:NAD(P)-dependent dehydrogenase (short-subunit alcohol dehydrogenase family)